MTRLLKTGPSPSLLLIGHDRSNILINRRAALVAGSAAALAMVLILLALVLGDFP